MAKSATDRGIYCTEDDDRWHPIYGPCPICGTYFRYDGDYACYTILNQFELERLHNAERC